MQFELTSYQKEAIDVCKGRDIFLKCARQSGSSTLAIELAKSLLDDNQRVMIVAANRFMADHIRENIGHNPLLYVPTIAYVEELYSYITATAPKHVIFDNCVFSDTESVKTRKDRNITVIASGDHYKLYEKCPYLSRMMTYEITANDDEYLVPLQTLISREFDLSEEYFVNDFFNGSYSEYLKYKKRVEAMWSDVVMNLNAWQKTYHDRTKFLAYYMNNWDTKE